MCEGVEDLINTSPMPAYAGTTPCLRWYGFFAIIIMLPNFKLNAL